MKNNFKIDLTSRAFILFSNVFLVIAGIVSVGFTSWYLYNGIKDDSKRIENILNLQDRVTIEVIDMKKLNSIKEQLNKHNLTDPDKRYVNPFIMKTKNEL